MFDSLLKHIALTILAAAAFVGGLFAVTGEREAPQSQPAALEQAGREGEPLGASIPVVVSLFETSLQSKITTSDTSMTLVSGTDRNGTALSGYMCFTLDEGTASVEFVCGTASSTAVSSMTRGIDPLTGTTSVASLKKEHRRGATVKITNYPQLAIISRILNGNETLPNRLSYDSSIATSTFTTYNLINKQYADGVALQGAPTATTSVAGVVQIGTAAQLQAGTAMSGAYTLVPGFSLFSPTSSATTLVPVTDTSGKLSVNFMPLSSTWTFTGALNARTATTSSVSEDAFNLIPAGTMQMYASSSAPSGWLLADGTSYATSSYPRLFAVIAYTYGGSSANFNVPDFRNRNAVGLGTTTPFNTLGNTGGATTTTLTIPNLPPHAHTTGWTAGDTVGGGTGNDVVAGEGNTDTGTTGSGTPVSILDPYLVVNFIIKY